ncbi:MAG: DUF354 domain-containing protein [Bacteroidetes bacterium]|nr:DUF354 domain-containing protein [Bacteroidota bacterium]
MKFLFYSGHPAQYLFFREIIMQLSARGHDTIILIKTKDVLEELVKNDGFEYKNILPRVRGKSKLSIAFSLLKRNLKILLIVLQQRPDILIGGDPSISQVGWLLRKKRFTLTEDDYAIIKPLARLTFPFAQTIVTPMVNNVGKWEYKKTGYNGYMKLAYLHPNIFTPDKNILTHYGISGKYALIRLARLTAHHDFGIKGLNTRLLDQSIAVFKNQGIQVFISSEDTIDDKYKDIKLKIKPADMHHILAHSCIFISDSQSMSVEASLLGVPSIRYSSFVGKISVLEELEHVYGLTFGISEGKEAMLIKKLREILDENELFAKFQKRRKKMLAEKIDVTAFMVWFIENYPKSTRIMKENPDYQYNFK